MIGPNVPWYLAVSGMLFGIGAIGVMLRRSPLIVLLSLEIMLNGGNLALVGFSRYWGASDGQVFAIAVMAVAASEVCVGLGLIDRLALPEIEGGPVEGPERLPAKAVLRTGRCPAHREPTVGPAPGGRHRSGARERLRPRTDGWEDSPACTNRTNGFGP